VISGEIGPSSSAMVNIDNELSVVSGADMAWIEETGLWAITPKGRLDATVTAYGRGFYTWTRRGGILLVHQSVADCEAMFTRTDGTVQKSKQMANIGQIWTLYREKDD
jgi:hypothetical protein